jgi:hypothetical protein
MRSAPPFRKDDKIVKLAIQGAKAKAGDGWRLLGPQLRCALVGHELLVKLSAIDTEGLDARSLLDKFQARMDYVIQQEDF